jgi:glyoxylase-like metal-dependent hydrolase (beta-lactamase superfamily II)
MSLSILNIVTGEIAENCWLVIDEKNRTILIDPGDAAAEIWAAAADLKIEHILLTHSHWDHILGLSEIVKQTGAPVSIHTAEAAIIEHGETNPPGRPVQLQPVPVAKKLEDGDTLKFGERTIQVIHTPGHTSGSCCFLFKSCSEQAEQIEGLFTGDTLFHKNHGRTDLPTGNAIQMSESLKKLCRLSPETVIYPGHDATWTIRAACEFLFPNQ